MLVNYTDGDCIKFSVDFEVLIICLINTSIISIILKVDGTRPSKLKEGTNVRTANAQSGHCEARGVKVKVAQSGNFL